MKQKKKVITDKFNLPDVGKDRSYMKTRTESLMKNETFFLLLDPKMKKSKKKKDQQQPQVNTSSNSVPKYSGSASNSVSSANAQRIDINLDNSNKKIHHSKCNSSMFRNQGDRKKECFLAVRNVLVVLNRKMKGRSI